MTASTDTTPALVTGPWEHVVTVKLLEPPSANRWWRMGRSGSKPGAPRHMHRSAEADAYINSAKLFFGSAVGPGKAKRWPLLPLEYAARLDITWFRSFRSGDLDKRQGILLDALQGLAYVKDSQVTCLVAERVDLPAGQKAHVVVRVYQIPTDIQAELAP